MDKQQIKQQIDAVLQTVRAIIDAVKEAGPIGIPSGNIYAVLMGAMTLEQYERLLKLALDSGVIQQDSSHRLYFVGA